MCPSFDVALPLVVSSIAALAVFLNKRYADKVKVAMKGRELRSKDAVVLSVVAGVMVSLVATMPSQALMVLFLSAYSFLLFQFSYIVCPRWTTSVLPPALFLSLYALLQGSVYWNPLMLDLFAILFAVLVSTFVGVVFTWRAAVAFAVAIAAVDVFQVFFTGSMVRAFEKTMELSLPVAVIVPVVPLIPAREPLYPAFPYAFSGLGLGDLFLLGLLVTKTAERYGRGFGLATALSSGVTFFVFETLAMNIGGGFYPATVFVISGWAIALFVKTVAGLVRPK